jgi:benzoyl-CoA reductase/2-hydroxyglutaryl-CoA dehydratase subunit BcrC/BadD/HgdB
MIEEVGGSIVADDLCIGSRYFWDLVEPASDPIRSLADRYQMRIACPCKHPSEERMERILDEVKKYRVEGVISIVQKYCDTHLFEYPYMKDVLEKNDIPFLYLETEDRMGEEGQFKTRVQAFIEMLR